MHIHFPSPSRLLVIIIMLFGIGGVYATINYSECFPNGCTLFQSLTNGWVTPTSSTSKEIMTLEGCKKVNGGATTNRYFIPTKTLAEWNSFKNHLPGGSNITECPISGVCGGSSNSCSVGTPSGYNPGSCGGSETWTCLGQYGGTNASCSIANPPCPTPINGLCNNAFAGFSPGSGCFAGVFSSYSAGSCGGSATWTCLGINGGTNDYCNHTNPPCCVPNVGSSCTRLVSDVPSNHPYSTSGSWCVGYDVLVWYSCPPNPQSTDICTVVCGNYVGGIVQCDGSCQ